MIKSSDLTPQGQDVTQKNTRKEADDKNQQELSAINPDGSVNDLHNQSLPGEILGPYDDDDSPKKNKNGNVFFIFLSDSDTQSSVR